MKKIFVCLIAFVILISSFVISYGATEKISASQMPSIRIAKIEDLGDVQALPDQEKTVIYSFQIAINDVYCTTLNVTINGTWNQYERYSRITNIAPSFSSPRSGFSTTKNISGNVGTVKLYYNNTFIATFTFKLLYNGNMTSSMTKPNGDIEIIEY